MSSQSDKNTARQVQSNHYDFDTYVTIERWKSYWHQVKEVLHAKPQSVLVVGSGDNLVPMLIRATVKDVKTFDFDPGLNSNYIGDVREITSIIPGKCFDVVLCCQVLEHLPFDFFESTILGLTKVARKSVIVSLPYNYRSIFSISLKLPLFSPVTYELTIPAFWKKWSFDGEHYWEVGTKGYSKRKIEQLISRVATIGKCFFASGNKYHLFYVIKGNCDQ